MFVTGGQADAPHAGDHQQAGHHERGHHRPLYYSIL